MHRLNFKNTNNVIPAFLFHLYNIANLNLNLEHQWKCWYSKLVRLGQWVIVVAFEFLLGVVVIVVFVVSVVFVIVRLRQ